MSDLGVEQGGGERDPGREGQARGEPGKTGGPEGGPSVVGAVPRGMHSLCPLDSVYCLPLPCLLTLGDHLWPAPATLGSPSLAAGRPSSPERFCIAGPQSSTVADTLLILK